MIEIKELSASEAWYIHEELVNKLYVKGEKPNPLRLPYAKVVLAVRKNKEWLAIACIFKNDFFNNMGMIGNYECINDDHISNMLLNAIENAARKLGFADLIGPMHGDTWHSYRFSLLPKAPFLMESVHQKYYPSQWQQNELAIWAEYQTNKEWIKHDFPQAEADAYFTNKQLTIKPFNIKRAIDDLKEIHAFCARVFVHNYLYSPISQADFLALYTPLLPYLKPSLIDMVMDKDKIVGLIFARLSASFA